MERGAGKRRATRAPEAHALKEVVIQAS